MISPISPSLSTNFCKFEQLKKKTNFFCFGPKQMFFLSLPVEKEIITNMYSFKKIVDSEFEIDETIWWAHQKVLALDFSKQPKDSRFMHDLVQFVCAKYYVKQFFPFFAWKINNAVWSNACILHYYLWQASIRPNKPWKWKLISNICIPMNR